MSPGDPTPSPVTSALTRSGSQLSEAWVVQAGKHEGQGATEPTHVPAHQPCSEVQAGVESWTSPYSYSHNHKNGSTIHKRTPKLNTYKCGQRLFRNNNKKKWKNWETITPHHQHFYVLTYAQSSIKYARNIRPSSFQSVLILFLCVYPCLLCD